MHRAGFDIKDRADLSRLADASCNPSGLNATSVTHPHAARSAPRLPLSIL
jgi:hypothetical protein